MQQAQEKLAKRQERREQKKVGSPRADNPLDDPTIDWSGAVRETKLPPVPEELAELSVVDDESAG
jgi:hypothetical protein